MKIGKVIVWATAAALALTTAASAQQNITKAPTAADWAAMAKLPDFNGVWEQARGGAPARGAGAPPAAAAAAPRGAAPAAGGRGGGAAGAGRGAGGGGGRGGGVQLTP